MKNKANRQLIERIEYIINDTLMEIQDNEGTLVELTEELERYRQTGRMSRILKGYLL